MYYLTHGRVSKCVLVTADKLTLFEWWYARVVRFFPRAYIWPFICRIDVRNIETYFHFLTFLDTEMVQRSWSPSTCKIRPRSSWVVLPWRPKEPDNQLWYSRSPVGTRMSNVVRVAILLWRSTIGLHLRRGQRFHPFMFVSKSTTIPCLILMRSNIMDKKTKIQWITQ